MARKLLFLKNKYILISLCLTIWVCFFDKNDLSTLIRLKQEVTKLENERTYFDSQIAEMTFQLKEMTTNPQILERFGREKYLMKRDNEDIFIIVEE